MSTKLEQLNIRAKFYVYLNLHGPEGLFNPLLEFLAQLGAERVSPDYPLWYFHGQIDARDTYVEQIGILLKTLPVRDNHVGPTEFMWRVLLMGPNSHHGFSRGCTVSEFERLKKEGRFS
jgi:hypothetical protein